MKEYTIEIIIVGIILIGMFSLYLGQIELASVALGSIAGYLGKGVTNNAKDVEREEADA